MFDKKKFNYLWNWISDYHNIDNIFSRIKIIGFTWYWGYIGRDWKFFVLQYIKIDFIKKSGILLVILLLGYGFVAVPRKYVRESHEEEVLD